MGELTLAYEGLALPADPGLAIVTYSAEPGSASAAALQELRRWAATRAEVTAARSNATPYTAREVGDAGRTSRETTRRKA